MSLYQQTIDAIDNSIKNLLNKISDRYNLSISDLYDLWNNDSKNKLVKSSPIKNEKQVMIEDILMKKSSSDDKKKKASVEEEKPKSKITEDEDLDPAKINNYNLKELQGLCKRHGLKVSGKKDELIKRLLGKEETTPKSSPIKEDKKVEEKKVSPKRITKKAEKKDEEVLQKIQPAAEIGIRRNDFGNYMHQPTSLIINKEKLVYGKQQPDGTVTNLTPEDIELCHQYKLQYLLPENLDQGKKTLDDVKVEGVDEEQKSTDETLEEGEEFEEYEEEVEYEYEEIEEEV
jgi:hypothetical protein